MPIRTGRKRSPAQVSVSNRPSPRHRFRAAPPPVAPGSPRDMSTQSERSARSGPAPPPAAPLHPRSFKLRFAAQREPGRSHLSAVKPLALPAPVADKPQRREAAPPGEAALRRVRALFARGPRERYAAPLTSSHEYGWWAARGAARAQSLARLDHHIRDSAWLKARVRVLAADAGYKR